jgi:hypothetical protein
MAVNRQTFAITNTAAGKTISGPAFEGSVLQLHWAPDQGDTGGDLSVLICPHADDTGGAFEIFSAPNSLGAAFKKGLAMPMVHKNNSDTGTNKAQGVYVSAGERLLVKVTSDTGVEGKLYITTYTG